MGEVAEVVLLAFVIALMAFTVVLSYWGLWKLLRWSSRTTADNWRTMDRRQRLTFLAIIAMDFTIAGLFFVLLSTGQRLLAVGLGAIVVGLAAGSIAAAIIASRRGPPSRAAEPKPRSTERRGEGEPGLGRADGSSALIQRRHPGWHRPLSSALS